jgi:thioredoxin-dependent peroxiredoxin
VNAVHRDEPVKANSTNVTSGGNLIPVGQQAPDFTALLSDGTSLSLAALQGKKRVVLVFYPGDNTPGCTSQLCALRDAWNEFQARDTAIYGVNPAGVERHAGFASRHSFPFPLIVDVGGKIAAAYGCRMLFGLIKRTVYVLDRNGQVAYVERGNPSPAEVLKAVEKLYDGPAPTD